MRRSAFFTMLVTTVIVATGAFVTISRDSHPPKPSSAFEAVTPQQPTPLDTPADPLCEPDAVNWNNESREAFLRSGDDNSRQTKLFDDFSDRCAQLHALDDNDVDPQLPTREAKAMSAVCSSSRAGAEYYSGGFEGKFEYGPDVLCGPARGYIISIRRSDLIDRVGHRWAKVFARYHPRNHHCALVIVEGTPSADLTKNDDQGNEIKYMNCYY